MELIRFQMSIHNLIKIMKQFENRASCHFNIDCVPWLKGPPVGGADEMHIYSTISESQERRLRI